MKKLKLSVLAMFLLSTFSIGNGYANTSEESKTSCSSTILEKQDEEVLCSKTGSVSSGLVIVDITVTGKTEEACKDIERVYKEAVKRVCAMLMIDDGNRGV